MSATNEWCDPLVECATCGNCQHVHIDLDHKFTSDQPAESGRDLFCHNPTTYGICGMRFDLHDEFTGHEPQQPAIACSGCGCHDNAYDQKLAINQALTALTTWTDEDTIPIAEAIRVLSQLPKLDKVHAEANTDALEAVRRRHDPFCTYIPCDCQPEPVRVTVQLVERSGEVSEVEIMPEKFNQLCVCQNFSDELDHLHLLRSKGCQFEPASTESGE